MDRISEQYNKIYTEHAAPFGIEPTPLVERVLDFTKLGSVIDLGAGDGRNSLFLASKGFQVTAVDISPIGIRKIEERAKEKGLTLETRVADISKLQLSNSYDLVVSTFVLHHLLKDQALDALKKAREATRPGGFNLITVFTKNGDFFKENQNTDKFFLSEGELKTLYEDWEVLIYLEREGPAFGKNPDGTPMKNVSAGIIARKP